jgi:hypothetical protein
LVELPEVVVCGFVVEVKLKLFDSVVWELLKEACNLLTKDHLLLFFFA